MKQPVVYMLATTKNGTIYIGVTAQLFVRVWQHRNEGKGFAAKYNATLLVWYELLETMESAILREKQLKAGSRAAKVRLIMEMNPEWRDLYPDLL